MEKHVTILGALYVAYSVLGLIFALIAFVAIVGGGAISGDEQAMLITGTVGTVVAFIMLVFSLPGLIGGIGLLRRAAWARILVLILSFLNLLSIPFGTLLGGYGIWVLLKEETVPLFQSGGRAGQPT